MRLLFALGLVAVGSGCRFHIRGAAIDGGATEAADLAGVGDDLALPDLLPPPDLSPPPDLAITGLLMGARSDIPSPVDLTGEGKIDWAHFGLNGAADVNRSSGGPAAIMLAGIGTIHQYSSYARTYSWTNGAPTASTTTNCGVFVNGTNNGFTLTVPADTMTRTLRVYLQNYNSGATLTAHLSDGSAADYTSSATNIGDHYARFTLVYRATAPGQTLRVSWTMTTDSGGGSVDVMAATLY